ncbi:MAG: deoxyribose-phosphate aldolase [Candidatus Marinimicrobia bacterium]|jgi:deoxyribose-phosphate aldolase|nr:deoxyribose-phosphate aldolase [Candidatus Neomarinimicrobiota bacterium]MCK9484130.1 deoxyribose-phosphate aldolase [Candidatus Neomarinimicrobiota bacterium]MCK9560660.1 deoxyribose-phosphate aldolase [Candidatus Neomarinimicrobiota bacterium]MDD5061540.1 deoxyribose-phosphate aldolase [Candidatus Neomarinimicrobiota bacterium]
MNYTSIISPAEARLSIAGLIDHTLLKPEATPDDIVRLCEEAVEYQFAAVCVNPALVKLSASCLYNSKVALATVIGFPLGANTMEIKAAEVVQAIDHGATELDMVINIGRLKANDLEFVEDDIHAVVDAADGNLVKVIIETALLTDEEKRIACQMAFKAGAHFVKTSTGFSKAGAKTEDVRLMRTTVGNQMGVKASGGIRTFADAIRMIEAGANRLGTSAGVQIVQESKTAL